MQSLHSLGIEEIPERLLLPFLAVDVTAFSHGLGIWEVSSRGVLPFWPVDVQVCV